MLDIERLPTTRFEPFVPDWQPIDWSADRPDIAPAVADGYARDAERIRNRSEASRRRRAASRYSAPRASSAPPTSRSSRSRTQRRSRSRRSSGRRRIRSSRARAAPTCAPTRPRPPASLAHWIAAIRRRTVSRTPVNLRSVGSAPAAVSVTCSRRPPTRRCCPRGSTPIGSMRGVPDIGLQASPRTCPLIFVSLPPRRRWTEPKSATIDASRRHRRIRYSASAAETRQ